MAATPTQTKSSLFTLACYAVIYLLCSIPAFAQVVDQGSVVSATVPDIVAPSSVVLIAPPDETLTNDATPTFVWQQATDNVGVTYYQFWLDGSLLFDNIPTSSTTNGQYTLNYDSNSGQYSLTPSALISNGTHTWSIVAYDLAGNNSTSVTWEFTVDTQAPSFIVTAVGEFTTVISAQDLSSVPTDPIELEDNEPILSGTGEPNAQVQLTVTIPDQAAQVINFTISGSGTWSVQLGILPRDVVIYLTFIITDSAGNSSVLSDLPILIIQEFIVFPPTPTPSPSPSGSPIASPPQSPDPSASPLASIEPTPTATPEILPSPIIQIPILPPKEIVEIVKKEVTQLVPTFLTNIVNQIPEQILETATAITNALGPVGAAVVATTIPAVGILATLLQLGQQLSWSLITKVLQAIGLIPPQNPQGIVFDSLTNKPVPFALLTVRSTKQGADAIIETLVTDVDGIYQGVQLPKGQYTIEVSHQDFNFPSKVKRPVFMSTQDFYLGEVFTIDSEGTQQLFLIPVDKRQEPEKTDVIRKTFWLLAHKLRRMDVFWPLCFLSILITIFYPTTLNFIVLAVYAIFAYKRMAKWLVKPNLLGLVLDATTGMPLENVTVRLINQQQASIEALLTTNAVGKFAAKLPPGKYQVQAVKTGFVWAEQGIGLSAKEVLVAENKQSSVSVSLTNSTQLYAEFM